MDADKLAQLKAKGIEPTTVEELFGYTEQFILNEYGVPHQVHQEVVQAAERAWMAVIKPHIADFSPVDKRIFLEYAMFGMSAASSEHMMIAGIKARQAARKHKELNKEAEKWIKWLADNT